MKRTFTEATIDLLVCLDDNGPTRRIVYPCQELAPLGLVVRRNAWWSITGAGRRLIGNAGGAPGVALVLRDLRAKL